MHPSQKPPQSSMRRSLTSQPLSTARWKARSCRGITLRMPCKQSTEWGTLIVLFVFLMVSISSLSQITTGRPWEENDTQQLPGNRHWATTVGCVSTLPDTQTCSDCSFRQKHKQVLWTQEVFQKLSTRKKCQVQYLNTGLLPLKFKFISSTMCLRKIFWN